MERVSYQIDGHDEIMNVSDSWAVFALSNNAAHLAASVEAAGS